MHTLKATLLSSILATSFASSSALPGTTADSLKAEAATACPDPEKGKVKCLAGGTYFVTCNGADSVPQPVSLGTQCVDGAIMFPVAAVSSLAVGVPSAPSSIGSTISTSSTIAQSPAAESSGSLSASSLVSSAIGVESSSTMSMGSDQPTMAADLLSTYPSTASSGTTASIPSLKIQAAVAAETPVPNGSTFDCKANNVTTRYLHCLSANTYVLCGSGAVPVFIVPVGSACDTTQDRFMTPSSSSSVTSALSSSSSSVTPGPVAAATPVPNGAYFNCKDKGIVTQSLHCIDENSYVECADVAKPVLLVPIGSKCDTSVDKITSSVSSSSSAGSSTTVSAVSTISSSPTSTTALQGIQAAAISILNSLLSKFAGQTSANTATATSSTSTMTTLSASSASTP